MQEPSLQKHKSKNSQKNLKKKPAGASAHLSFMSHALNCCLGGCLDALSAMSLALNCCLIFVCIHACQVVLIAHHQALAHLMTKQAQCLVACSLTYLLTYSFAY